MRKPNSVIIVLLYIFHIIHPQKQKRSVGPFCFWGEHSKGLSNQADVELDMINAISATDIAFIMSSSQAIVNWLNALDQSDFSYWVWCIIINVDTLLVKSARGFLWYILKIRKQYSGCVSFVLYFLGSGPHLVSGILSTSCRYRYWVVIELTRSWPVCQEAAWLSGLGRGRCNPEVPGSRPPLCH